MSTSRNTRAAEATKPKEHWWKGIKVPEKIWKGTERKAFRWWTKNTTLTPPAGPTAEAREDNTPGNSPQQQETPAMMAPELRLPNTPAIIQEWNTTALAERTAPEQELPPPPPLPRQEPRLTLNPIQGTTETPALGQPQGEERQSPRLQPRQPNAWDREIAMAYLQSHHPQTYRDLMANSIATQRQQEIPGDRGGQAGTIISPGHS